MDRHSDMTELIGPDGIFLRTADRKRFDYVLRGVAREGDGIAPTEESIIVTLNELQAGLRKIEADYEKEDEQMMIRLIKVRHGLWT